MRRAALVAALIASNAAAWAQTPPATGGASDQAARNYVRSGIEAFEAGRHAEAARAFREAHAISHRPELLFNIGRAEAAAGNLAAAVEALTLFRAAGAPNFDRAALDQQIRDLEAQRDEQARAESATPARAAVVEPRWYRVEYQQRAVHAVGPWVTLGVGAALGVAGIIQGVAAASNVGILRDVNRGQSAWSQSAQEARDAAPGQVTRATILGATGGALVLGGALWLILRGRGERREVRTDPVLGLSPAGLGLSIAGSM